MPLNGATVKSGSSAMTPTGGSDKTFTSDGVTIPNGIHLANAAQTDFRIRENLTLKNKVPSLGVDGTYSKDRKSATYVVPKILANGKTVFPLIRIEREVHPEMTAAECLELNMIGAQILTDADFTPFYSGGSLL